MQAPVQSSPAAFAQAIRALLREGQYEKAFTLENDLAAYYEAGKPSLAQLGKKYGVSVQNGKFH